MTTDERSGTAGSAIRALDTATRAIAAELDLDRVLQLMVDSVRDLVDARYAALGIIDGQGGIERFITSGLSPEERARIGALPRGHGLLGTIIRDSVSLRIPDIAAHPDTYGFPPNHPPMRSFLGVPVRIGAGPIGNFYLTEKRGATEFSEADLELVELFGLHAAIAIQHARLHQRVRELAVVDERLRISRDLHDGIIQAIYAVALSLEDVPDLVEAAPAEAADRVDRAIDRLNTTIRDIRTFITGLGTEAFGIGIGEALEAAALELAADSPLTLDLDLREGPSLDARLPAQVAHEVIQIAREALSNVVRHSGATRATVSLRADGDTAVLSIQDDGRGFEAGDRAAAGHFGLANLRDRAAGIGGTTRIESAPGQGTRIIVRLPMLDVPPDPIARP